VISFDCYAECHFAECHLTERHFAERHFAKHHFAQCRCTVLALVKIVEENINKKVLKDN
jgi:hypothetical protein